MATAAFDRQPSVGRQWIGLIGFLLLCFIAAAVGGAATSTSVNDWYPTLAKPDWTPPSWLFGPVWSTLYFLMAVAAWLVWRNKRWQGASGALALFALQLLLNVLWSVLFFGMESPGLAFVEVVLLWIAIAATMAAFWRHSVVAALLLAPYLGWTTFASALNFAIWRMNA
jgi:tryptophan-rich sensory protein